MQHTTPPLPLPAPLYGAEAGTFAHHTVTKRLPETARRTLRENSFLPQNQAALEALAAEIPTAPLRPLREELAPDAERWAAYVSEHLGKNWLEVPWFFAEAYFFRRVLEAAGYFYPGPHRGLDPFLHQKNLGYNSAVEQIHSLCRQLNQALSLDEQSIATVLPAFLRASLWGNQADLSLWPIGAGAGPGLNHDSVEEDSESLLVDHTAELTAYLQKLPGARPTVDFINDNAGFELVTDLCLADYVLSLGLAEVVRFHLKPHPTFVSDTTAADVEQTIALLGQPGSRDANLLASRLSAHLSAGRLRLTTHHFWTSPLAGWEMPEDLRLGLEASALVISKGDMNYRRWLGDLHWPFTAPFPQIVRYFPAPLVCLRTTKSEVICGLQEEQLAELARTDPNWLTSGHWGLIQFKN